MSQLLWIIDPDPTSAQALRSAIDLLGCNVETYDRVPTSEDLPKAVLIAGPTGSESLQQWVSELRRMGGNDLLPITLIGGLKNSAEALALGADHYLDAPLIIADLWDHLRGFLTLSTPNDPEREIPLSRGIVDRDSNELTTHQESGSDLIDTIEPEVSSEADAQDPSNQIHDVLDAGSVEPIEDDEDQDAQVPPLIKESIATKNEDEPDEGLSAAPTREEPLTRLYHDRNDHDQETTMMAAETEPPTTPIDASSKSQPDEQLVTEELIDDDHNHESLSPEPISDTHLSDTSSKDDQPKQQAKENQSQSDPLPTQTNQAEPLSKDVEPKDLFGLKQPKEVNEMSSKSENAEKPTQSRVEDQPSDEPDFNADSAWGLNDSETLAEPNTTGWDTSEITTTESWDTDENTDSNWGESNPSWGDDSSASDGWKANTDADDGWGSSPNWSSSSGSDQTRSNLSQIGQQLMPPELKPRAPVSPLGPLHSTGLLGLLARCGQERVSGRISWQHDSESIILHLHDGRLKAIDSALFDHDLLQAALAQGWIDTQELTGVEHLMQRRHSSAASVLAREGIKSSDAIQQLAQETAERILLRCSNVPGGYAQFHPEMDIEQAVAVSQTDTTSRLITLCEGLAESSLWTALIGGDDAVPTLHSAALPQHLPGRDALHAADGARSLLELATSHGVAINDVRSGCLAALILGQIELAKVGVSSIQHSHRPDQTFERALKQIRSGNYFTVLGLPEAHSAAEVHRAFAARVSLLRLYLHANHPRFAEAYEELEEARDVLLDPDLRAQYRSANPQTLER